MTLAESASAFARQAMAWDVALEGAAVTLNEVAYTNAQAAVSVGPVESRDLNGQWYKVHNLVVRIYKTALANEPAVKSALSYGGVIFTVNSVGGQAATEAAWELRCSRWVE